ncbi:hypothetical protein Ancab_025851 [Ancistrocladus abbreviatus]
MWPRSSNWFDLGDDTISIAGTISIVVPFPSDILIIGEASGNAMCFADLEMLELVASYLVIWGMDLKLHKVVFGGDEAMSYFLDLYQLMPFSSLAKQLLSRGLKWAA